MASKFESLVRVDLVRASKLLQQVQTTLLVFVLAFAIGSIIDRLFPVVGNPEDISHLALFRDLTIQLSLITIAAFYIMKVAAIIPFYFSLSSEYVPNSHGEAAAGAGLAMALIFGGVQKNFQARINVLKARIY
jgi:hypothetical protein